ncbi:class F sortase [Streptomyces sp. JJ38]|uniref:class F sortase n=1 Tax=Streptomyces sp. JJ38 TaxID=2738128 RepID=UPI001C57DEE6|nr:class F sortase [Streptomyces sp. JJ38]MBW1598426.1 class F sortase [Streptomyces sp. JJ38]
MSGEARSSGTGRLMTGTAWAVLLLALWLWGKDLTDAVPPPAAVRDVAAGTRAGEEGGHPLPPTRAPLADRAAPQRVAVEGLGVDAVVVPRGLDEDGAVDPPPFREADTVGWYAGGPAPGEEGAALLVGHVDTETDRAVFYELSTVKPGTTVLVTRADGTVAEFTVEDVEVVQREGFDAERVYGHRHPGRAELRLITCGGTFDEKADAYTANVVVSAYLSGVRPG